MFGDNRTILPDDDAAGIGLHLDWPPHGTRGDGVSDIVEPHEAGLRDRRHAGVEAIEAAGTWNQIGSYATVAKSPKRTCVLPRVNRQVACVPALTHAEKYPRMLKSGALA